MAPRKKAHTVGTELETTIIFTPKNVLEELLEAKRNTKKRTQSLAGTLGEKIGKAVEDKHLDRTAFSIAAKLDAMDDERLHRAWHNLLKYAEDLGVVKRATAQEEMFEAGGDGAEETNGKGKNGGGGKDAAAGDGDGKVTQIGTAARAVAERAGADKPH